MTEKPTICEICGRHVDISGGEGYYECDKCGQEVCSECCDNDPNDSMGVICDDCWSEDTAHSYDDPSD